jgi:hypothetical protein
MKKIITIIVMAIAMNGCAVLQKKREVREQKNEAASEKGVNSKTSEEKARINTHIQAQARNLDTAKNLLQENKVSTATEILANIVSTDGVPGVTDEALFRLAMLNLQGGQGKSDIASADISQAQSFLEEAFRIPYRTDRSSQSADKIPQGGKHISEPRKQGTAAQHRKAEDFGHRTGVEGKKIRIRCLLAGAESAWA